MSTKKISEKEALSKIEHQLQKYFNVSFAEATDKQLFNALAHVSIEQMFEKREDFSKHCKASDGKAVNYLCMEFLIGKTLQTTLFNLGLENAVVPQEQDIYDAIKRTLYK